MPQEDVVTCAPLAIWNALTAVVDSTYMQPLPLEAPEEVMAAVDVAVLFNRPPPIGEPKNELAFSTILTVAQ